MSHDRVEKSSEYIIKNVLRWDDCDHRQLNIIFTEEFLSCDWTMFFKLSQEGCSKITVKFPIVIVESS